MPHTPNPDGEPFMLYCEVEIWCNCGEEYTYRLQEEYEVHVCEKCGAKFHITSSEMRFERG